MNVWRNEWGTSRPFYFPFQYSYWFPGAASSAAFEDQDFSQDETLDKSNVEAVPEEDKARLAKGEGVAIRGLTKIFHSGSGSKVAVDGLTVSMYTGMLLADRRNLVLIVYTCSMQDKSRLFLDTMVQGKQPR